MGKGGREANLAAPSESVGVGEGDARGALESGSDEGDGEGELHGRARLRALGLGLGLLRHLQLTQEMGTGGKTLRRGVFLKKKFESRVKRW